MSMRSGRTETIISADGQLLTVKPMVEAAINAIQRTKRILFSSCIEVAETSVSPLFIPTLCSLGTAEVHPCELVHYILILLTSIVYRRSILVGDFKELIGFSTVPALAC